MEALCEKRPRTQVASELLARLLLQQQPWARLLATLLPWGLALLLALLELLPLHRLVALVLVARLSLGRLHALPQLLSLLQLLQTRSVETPWFDLGTICYSWRRMQYTNRSNRG